MNTTIYRTPIWSLIINTGFFIGIFLLIAIPMTVFFNLVLNNDSIDNTPKQVISFNLDSYFGIVVRRAIPCPNTVHNYQVFFDIY